MWVRSQNKQELANCISFSVRKNIGGKKRSAISGIVSISTRRKEEVLLGLYDTEEMAINELTRLQDGLVNNTKIYEMN